MKKQIALVLAGAAASVAGGLRLVQELVDRGDRHSPEPPSPVKPSSKIRRPPGRPRKPAPPVTTGAPSGASKAELYEIATKLAISGRSKMSKGELIDAINTAG